MHAIRRLKKYTRRPLPLILVFYQLPSFTGLINDTAHSPMTKKIDAKKASGVGGGFLQDS